MNAFLYLATVLIWGSTWVAITFQLGEAPLLISIFYRFALASLILLPILWLTKKLQPTTYKDHVFLVLQGLCLFSFNFICFYNATSYIVSGLVSIVFSLATLYNVINNRIFYKELIPKKILLAGIIGVSGLVIIFWPELEGQKLEAKNTLTGLGFAAVGTYLFSLGNMISKRHSQRGLNPLTAIAWAMFYGSLALLFLISITQTEFNLPTSFKYLGSLFYLSIFGSIIAFTTYLMLVARIGANQAAYATIMFPVIALLLSAYFESFTWHIMTFVGMGLTIIGNLIVFTRWLDPKKKLT